MAYHHGWRNRRDAYEEHFQPRDTREVAVHRVVNIIEKRASMPHPGMDYSRGMDEDQWYGGPQNYNNGGNFHRETNYLNDDYGYFEENPHYGRFRRNPSPSNREAPYSHPHYARDDLRHQLRSRSNGGPGPSFKHRGRGFGSSQRETHNNHRPSQATKARTRCPVKKKAQSPAPVSAGSTASNKNGSSDKDKGCSSQDAQQKNKPNAATDVDLTPSSPVEESPHSSASSKEKPSASVSESEEVVEPSMKPEPTQEDDIMVRRSQAIKAKALEIEKDYRQDCETFCTVVKMLVAKEPSLDNLLHRALNENLLEIKQHCLDSLRHYVTELDEVLEAPDTSTNAESQK